MRFARGVYQALRLTGAAISVSRAFASRETARQVSGGFFRQHPERQATWDAAWRSD
jgi:hypothetical protein